MVLEAVVAASREEVEEAEVASNVVAARSADKAVTTSDLSREVVDLVAVLAIKW